MTISSHQDLAVLTASELCKLGKEALDARNYPLAHRLLQAALKKERSADHLSLFALALAHHCGNTSKAAALCHEALKLDPKNPEHYLRLGIIHFMAGRRKETVRMLQLGLRAGKHAGISRLLQIMGQRKKPVLPFLSRSNPLNKYLGKMRARLAARR